MTAAEKKERRDLKHDLQRLVMRNHFGREVKMTATTNQLKQHSRQVADRLLAGKNPHTAIRIA